MDIKNSIRILEEIFKNNFKRRRKMEPTELIESIEKNLPEGFSFKIKGEKNHVSIAILKGDTVLHSQHVDSIYWGLVAIHLFIEDLIK